MLDCPNIVRSPLVFRHFILEKTVLASVSFSRRSDVEWQGQPWHCVLLLASLNLEVSPVKHSAKADLAIQHLNVD
jgi:hypothetical protein